MKKVSFKELSDETCVDCGNKLKKNLVNRNPDAKRCYVCHKLRTRSQNFNRIAFRTIQRHRKAKNAVE